ncbi:hypothetical protein [Rheinheimera texasensis]|uniref:hypothetical protein n=1 Tax=Rheinheimera texasensis TaxID=306205 RepID=UPI0012FF2073|nr:hypothetical protein [Rheinheimera texasensis]
MQNRRIQALLLFMLSVLVISSQLLWQLWQGGIDSHHLLADPTLPSISNVWGLVLLPMLGALTACRLVQAEGAALMWRCVLGALLYGLMLAALFLNQQESILIGAILLTFVLALWLPLYRVEYVVGYVAGLSFALGPVLPLLPASPAIVIALISMKVKTTLWRTSDVKKA